MEEDYFNLEKWKKWVDNNSFAFKDIVNGKTIAFNISGFNEGVILLTKEINDVDVSYYTIPFSKQEITKDDADLLFEIKPLYLDNILNEKGFSYLSNLLKRSCVMFFKLVSDNQLFNDGFSNFLSDIGFDLNT